MASNFLLAGVFVLDLIAFALAVAAEHQRARVTIDSNEPIPHCAYSSNVATVLGVVSLLFLLTAQVLIMVVTRCLCCGKALQPGRRRVWAIVMFIVSWFTFFIAVVCLVAGSAGNARRSGTVLINGTPHCSTLRRGVFAAGAAFIVFTGILSSLFYINYSNADESHPPQSRDAGIRMGQI